MPRIAAESIVARLLQQQIRWGTVDVRVNFPGFYQPTTEEFAALWADCIFVVDANVLLNLYRYPRKARDELLKAFSQVEERLWVPFQAALEYQRNRPTVMAEQKRRFREVRDVVGSVLKGLEADFGKLQLRDRHALIDPDGLIAGIRPLIENYQTELDKLEQSQLNVHEDDPLRSSIDKLFDNRVGPSPSQKDIDEIIKNGDARYKFNTPPGFADEKKGNSEDSTYSYLGVNYAGKYGDLILWEQILLHASKTKDCSLVLITDDEKQDWWWTVDSQGKKKLGPRPELVAEIVNRAKVKSFYIYNSEQFLKYARAYLKAEVSDESIGQVREVAYRSSNERIERMREEAMIAEEAVGQWLLREHPEYEIQREFRAWPDFVLKKNDSDDTFAVDVIVARIFPAVHQRLRERLYRAFHDVQTRGLSRFELVIVVPPDGEIDRIIAFVSGGRIEIPSGVRVVVGTLSQTKDGSASFTPLAEGQPSFQFHERS